MLLVCVNSSRPTAASLTRHTQRARDHRTTDAIQKKIAGALAKADTLFAKMRTAWDGLIKKTPSILSNSG